VVRLSELLWLLGHDIKFQEVPFRRAQEVYSPRCKGQKMTSVEQATAFGRSFGIPKTQPRHRLPPPNMAVSLVFVWCHSLGGVFLCVYLFCVLLDVYYGATLPYA
jgi:hypothetical protein